MRAITMRAFAKVNLSLRVGDRRPDGFHEVRTVLQALELHDRLTFERTRGPFEIRCSTPGVPTDRTNLIWKAARRMWAEAGRTGSPRGVRVNLVKRIPMQAGLGGGSSDAAAALLAFRQLWRPRLEDERLHAIAAGLGSDVPYFFIGGTAIALGRGEDVYPLENLPPFHVLLVIPPFGVSTRDAYAWLDHRRRRGLTPSGVCSLLNAGNDLEAPVAAKHPEIRHWIQRLTAGGAGTAAMSGSGSTVFGVFRSGRTAARAAAELIREGAHVIRTRFRPRRSRPSLLVRPLVD